MNTKSTVFFAFLLFFLPAQPVCFGRRLLFTSEGEAPGRRGCGKRKKGRPARHRSDGGAKSTGLTVVKWRGVGSGGGGSVQNAEKCPFCMCDSLLLPRKMKRSVWPGAHRKEPWTLAEGASRKRGTRAHARAQNLNQGFVRCRLLSFTGHFRPSSMTIN